MNPNTACQEAIITIQEFTQSDDHEETSACLGRRFPFRRRVDRIFRRPVGGRWIRSPADADIRRPAPVGEVEKQQRRRRRRHPVRALREPLLRRPLPH